MPARNAPPEQAISAILLGCKTILPSGETRNGRIVVNFESEGGRQAEIYRLLRDYADAGQVVVIFCTEVLEVYEAADRVHVLADGHLSSALNVGDYDQVEQLATDITRLEQENRGRELRVG